MLKNASVFFTRRQLVGLNKLGDVFAPGNHRMPRFSQTGCVVHVDKLAYYMSEKDREDLASLLTIVSYFPTFLLVPFFWILECSFFIPGSAGAVFRFARLGVKGMVASLYYSGLQAPGVPEPTTADLIGYRARVDTSDLEKT